MSRRVIDMWYWNPVDCNEALPGVHNLSGCIEIDDNAHPFKTQTLPEGKVWGNGEDNQPVLHDAPAPTAKDLATAAESQKVQLKAIADSEIDWRQDAVDAGIATEDETTALADWKKYRVLLMRVDTSTAPDIDWPTQPEQAS
ncbi:tail fiber assembly protein [Enterobacter hormaechei]|nr:hypothetical protein CIG28_03620 [Enterobacter hormaechei]QLV77461.1 tail fiber assembly protein [Enterobacter hormaechei]